MKAERRFVDRLPHSAGPDSHRLRAGPQARTQFPVGLCDLPLQVGREPRPEEEVASLLCFQGQAFGVPQVQAGQEAPELRQQPSLPDQVTVCLRSDREACWDAHPMAAEVATHLAQESVLTPHKRRVVRPDLLKP